MMVQAEAVVVKLEHRMDLTSNFKIDVTSNMLGHFGKDFIILMLSHLYGNIMGYVCITC